MRKLYVRVRDCVRACGRTVTDGANAGCTRWTFFLWARRVAVRRQMPALVDQRRSCGTRQSRQSVLAKGGNHGDDVQARAREQRDILRDSRAKVGTTAASILFAIN